VRLLVLGAGGMLGHKLCQYLPTRGHDVTGAIRKDPESLRGYGSIYSGTKLMGGVDALNDEALARTIKDAKPDFVINCIGIVKQLQEAENAYLSVAINSYLPHRLALLCEAHGARLIHISTDCVFDGARGNYTEKDFSDARDMYGKSKFLGETSAAEKCAVTLRTSFIGRELHRPTHGLVEWLLAEQNKQVKGFARAMYSGFSSLELAKVISHVIERSPKLHGLYQPASAPISKYELLLLIRESYGLNIKIERDENFKCDRSMQGAVFRDATGYVAPSWNMMIREMRDDPTPYDQFANNKGPA
jgi:dTDP-4-dehydrorhamnose reductase